VEFNDADRVILTLDLGHTHAHVCAMSLRAERLAHRGVTLDVTASPEVVLGTLLAAGDAVLAELPRAQVVGVGFGVPAPVDVVGSTDWRTSPMRDWSDETIHTTVQRRWPVPVVLENDARALAIGEASLDPADESGANILMAVKLASGIGAGIVVDGHPLRGATGAAGDIGHIRLQASGPLCRCGRRGCLAAYASGRAVLRRLSHRRLTGLQDVVALLDAGDEEVMAVVTEAASAVGVAVGGALQGVNPKVLVLGGVLGAHPLVARVVTAKVRMVALPRVLERTQIRRSVLGEDAGSVGLAHLLLRHLYSPDAIDRLLEPARASG
jgi:predicted NBD/HSP70 family sugar kinase